MVLENVTYHFIGVFSGNADHTANQHFTAFTPSLKVMYHKQREVNGSTKVVMQQIY
jgi:hypothetical protein